MLSVSKLYHFDGITNVEQLLEWELLWETEVNCTYGRVDVEVHVFLTWIRLNWRGTNLSA
jgi:hypothetical protein